MRLVRHSQSTTYKLRLKGNHILQVQIRHINRTQPMARHVYPHVKFLGINYFRLPTFFPKTFEDILDRCNTRHHQLKLLVNQKKGPSPPTIIQIYKNVSYPFSNTVHFRQSLVTSDNIISRIQRLQNKFIGLASVYQIIFLQSYYMTPVAFHTLLSCAAKTLDRIAQNPL